jgi:hypothetical protein
MAVFLYTIAEFFDVWGPTYGLFFWLGVVSIVVVIAMLIERAREKKLEREER